VLSAVARIRDMWSPRRNRGWPRGHAQDSTTHLRGLPFLAGVAGARGWRSEVSIDSGAFTSSSAAPSSSSPGDAVGPGNSNGEDKKIDFEDPPRLSSGSTSPVIVWLVV
jgi:hypothetical protein